MRGVDLNVFDFDYDLTWAALFMNADEKIYGRYGGRGPGPAEEYLTLPALKQALRAALAAHRSEAGGRPAGGRPQPRTVEQYAAARRLAPGACIHCHQVYDLRRQDRVAAGAWRLDDAW